MRQARYEIVEDDGSFYAAYRGAHHVALRACFDKYIIHPPPRCPTEKQTGQEACPTSRRPEIAIEAGKAASRSPQLRTPPVCVV
jgi:hypothetical protein